MQCFLSLISLHSLKKDYHHHQPKNLSFEVKQFEVHEEFGWNMTSESKSWFDLTLKKSFICLSISPKLLGQFLTWLENNFIKCGGCDIPDFTATPIFSANLPWHATDTHYFLSMISLHSLKALKNFFQADSYFKEKTN